MQLSYLFFGDHPDEKWSLARQMGIQHAIAKLSTEHTGKKESWSLAAMEDSVLRFKENGLKLIGLEGDQFNMNRIKFGLPGREEDLDKYCQMLENMGRLGIPLLCYNFMAGIGWYRTQTEIRERGGALVSGFDQSLVPADLGSEFPQITEADLWNHYRDFLNRVLPVAEKAGVKMALHPDDPPISPLGKIPRIFTSGFAIRKALALSSSSSHGLTFCQGSYTTMGEDIFKLIEEFGSAQKIFFIHIRDVAGSARKFNETFHDNGPTHMVAAFRAYQQWVGGVPLRSDHVPTMDQEDNTQHGYGSKGNLFGIGYIKGIMDSLEIPCN